MRSQPTSKIFHFDYQKKWQTLALLLLHSGSTTTWHCMRRTKAKGEAQEVNSHWIFEVNWPLREENRSQKRRTGGEYWIVIGYFRYLDLSTCINRRIKTLKWHATYNCSRMRITLHHWIFEVTWPLSEENRSQKRRTGGQ